MNARNIPEMWRLFLLAIQGDGEAWAILVLRHFNDDVRRRVNKRYRSAIADQSDVVAEVSTSPIKTWSGPEFAEKRKITDPEIQFKLMYRVMMRVADCRAVDLARKNGMLKVKNEKLKDLFGNQPGDIPGTPRADVPPRELAIENEMREHYIADIYQVAEDELRENDRWIIHRWIDLEGPRLTNVSFRRNVADEFESSLEAATKRIQRAFEKLRNEMRGLKEQQRQKKLMKKIQSKPSPAALSKLAPDPRWIIEYQDKFGDNLDQFTNCVMRKFNCTQTEASQMIIRARDAWKMILQDADSSLV